MVLDPTDLGLKLGATIVVAPGQMPGGFLPSPDADCLPFLVKLVPWRKHRGGTPARHQVGPGSMTVLQVAERVVRPIVAAPIASPAPVAVGQPL